MIFSLSVLKSEFHLLKRAFLVTALMATFSLPAFSANTTDNPNITFIPGEKQNIVILKRAPNFPQDVIGMTLNAQDSIAASQEYGAVAQYIIGANEVDSNGLDKKVLIQEMNDSISVAAQYFKNKPDYKGTLVLLMTYYPGYKRAYQLPIPSGANRAERAKFNKMNQLLKDDSQCNNAGFCSVLATEYAEFFNLDNPSQKLDKKEYMEFTDAHTSTKDVHLYHTNPKATSMAMLIYIGVNGHLTTKDFAIEHSKKITGQPVK